MLPRQSFHALKTKSPPQAARLLQNRVKLLFRTSGRVASRDALAKLDLLLASYLPRSGSRFLLYLIGSGASDGAVLRF